MSETKTIIEKVKALVFEEETPEVEAKFLDATTTDGVAIQIEGETLEVGAIVSIVTEEGNEVSGAATYVLDNGSTITVDEEGKISEVTETVEEEDEAVEEAEMEEETPEEVNPLEEKVANLESKLDEIIAKFSEVQTKVEEFSKLPAEDELKEVKKDVKVSLRESNLDKLAKFRK